MPDERVHRGPHPEDETLFAPAAWPALRSALVDLSWLLSRNYAAPSALKLVGDRFHLAARQRLAVSRCAASDQAVQRRRDHACDPENLAGRTIWIDGFNVLLTIEAALGGGVVLVARDGCYRDMASVHGTYRRVAETVDAIGLIGAELARLQVVSARWFLDRPVSNSGRLKAILEAEAATHGWSWQVELVADPDLELRGAAELVATSDSVILDHCQNWFNLARQVVVARVPQARVVDLSPP